MSGPPTASGLYIPTDPDPIFGWLHLPREGTQAGSGVLICPPFGWEDFCSYRGRRAWAQHLAERGYPALRIDLPSMGDSLGSPRDRGRLDAWTKSVGGAADWLRATSGCTRVTVIGIGLGGLVAVRAVAEGAAIDDLVVWAVTARGKRLLRELRAFAMLNAELDPADAIERPSPPDPQDESDDGSLEVGGFLLNAETVADLGAIDLTTTALPGSPDRRALMLERDGMAVDRRLREFLVESGVDVSVAPGPGYTAMTAHPQEAEPPTAEFATVDSWLADAPTLTGGGSHRASTSERINSHHVGAGGSSFRETAITIPQPFGDLRGILTEPTEMTQAGICAVFLNAGALRRIGPGRMWVDTARRWAAVGIPTLRVDLEGIGDADGDGSPYRDTAALYVPRLIDQVIATLDQLERRGLPDRFVIAGLCSGAYWGFHAALRDDRVSAAFLINPRALFWDPLIESSRNARKAAKVLRGSTWRRFLRGEVPLSRIGPIARGGLDLIMKPRASVSQGRGRRNELNAAFEKLESSETRILLAFSGNEPLAEEFEREGSWDVLASRSGVELVEVPGSDHTLRPIRIQKFAREMLDGAIQAELTRSRQAS